MRSRVRPREVWRLRGGSSLVEGNAAVGHGRRGRWRRMSDVLEACVLEVVWHHGVLWRRVRVARHGALLLFVVFIVGVFLAHKVLGPLVFMCAAILRDLSVVPFSGRLSPGRWGGIHIGRPLVASIVHIHTACRALPFGVLEPPAFNERSRRRCPHRAR